MDGMVRLFGGKFTPWKGWNLQINQLESKSDLNHPPSLMMFQPRKNFRGVFADKKGG